MAGKSTIEWTQVTWNPVTGCTKISAGCKNYRSKLDHDICISAKAFRGELL